LLLASSQVIKGDFERHGYSTFFDHKEDTKQFSVGIRTLITVSKFERFVF